MVRKIIVTLFFLPKALPFIDSRIKLRYNRVVNFSNEVIFTQDDKNSLLSGAVLPALLRYALPIILSMIATQLYTVVDTMIIGLKLDADALAAVSNASTVLMIFLFISGGMELGGGLLIAANKPTATRSEMNQLLYNLLFVDEVLALLLTVLGFVFLPGLLRLIQTPAEILNEAVLYGRVYLIGLPFLMPYDLSKQMVMGCGNSSTPLRVVIVTSVLNVLLDLALVGPFGVAGAAAATAASQVVGVLYMMFYLRRHDLDEPFRFQMLRAEYAKKIFTLAAPNSLQQASGTIITLVKQSLLGGLGVAAIAGFSCASKISSLLMMPVYGFVQSVVFFIAQNTAADQPDRVQTGLREGRRILFGYSVLVVAVCILLRQPLLRLFTTDERTAYYGAVMLAFESVGYLFVTQKHLLEAQLRGAQKMGLYLVSNLGQIALNLLCCVILVPLVGFNGFWLSTWVSYPAGLLLAYVLVKVSAQPSQSR